MKVFIAGAGEVGTHLAKLLCTDEHDITLMDSEPERLEFAYESSFEILPIVGDPTSINDLESADAGASDLFVSVTPHESTNMIACTLASKLGAKKTLARINNDEYLKEENRKYFASIGIDEMIYPERLAAEEIVESLKLPWTRQYWSLFDQKLSLIAVKMENSAPLIGKRLMELNTLESKIFHIVAIKRHFNTIIPTGADEIKEGDIVFFTCETKHLDDVREYTGHSKVEVKKVIIMGGGRIAVRTTLLLPDDIRVKIIERNHEKCKKLVELVSDNTLVINGDASDTTLLKEEGIETTQAFIALTSNSEANMLTTLNAKNYGVYHTTTQIENLDYMIMSEQLGIGNTINRKLIAAGTIFRHLLNIDVSNMKCLSVAKADVVEVIAREGSKATKCQVKDLKLPKGVTLGGLQREEEILLIDGNTEINPNDKVMVFCCNTTSISKIHNIFG